LLALYTRQCRCACPERLGGCLGWLPCRSRLHYRDKVSFLPHFAQWRTNLSRCLCHILAAPCSLLGRQKFAHSANRKCWSVRSLCHSASMPPVTRLRSPSWC